MMSQPSPLTSSSSDEDDLIGEHPVPYQDSLTHSWFDDDDLIDRHPVSR
jgi:hypothetical protein